MILRNVECKWPSVIEPNTKFDNRWEILAILNKEQAAVLADHGFKINKEEDGKPSYRFKRNCQIKKKDGGTVDKPAPIVVDASNVKFEKLIGNGSIVNIQYSIKNTTFNGTSFINGDLEGVQVMKHVSYGTGASEFESLGETEILQAEQESPIDDIEDSCF